MRIVAAFVAWCLWLPLVEARPRPPATVPAPRPATTIADPTGDPDQPDPPPKEDPKEYEEFIRGANLDTDSEVQALLRRAREHLDEKRYREAVTVLQHIIDRPGGTLTTADGRVFRPTGAIATEILANLPREGLDVYRLWADGEARGLIGDPSKSVDAEVLGQVVRRFFLSSLGDDAALRLACLAMDRRDFSQARRLLGMILNVYPDPSVDPAQVLLRQALACSRMSDSAGARAAWAKLAALRSARLGSNVLAAVDGEIKAQLPRDAAASRGWTMAFGSSLRTGWVADLPSQVVSSTEKLWAMEWEQTIPVASQTADPRTGRAVVATEDLKGVRRNSLLGWWDQNKAVPTCQVAVVGDRLFYKTSDSLVGADLRTGKRLWETREHQSAQPNVTGGTIIGGYNPYAGNESHGLFLDHLARAVSVVDERVYHIEENSKATRGYATPRIIVNGQVKAGPKPLDGNALSAHDAATGRRLWRLGREADESKPLSSVRFVAPPVGCLGKLLVPAEVEGELVLVALEPANGSIAWKTFLCTFASARMTITRPVGLWVDGAEVLVASGKGVIFCLDGVDGSLHWACRYEPKAPEDRSMFYQYRYSARGWQEDYVAATGNLAIAVPSDCDSVLALDRRSGALVFSKEVQEPRYCLGLRDGGLFVVGGKGLSRLDLARADWSWHSRIAANGGRGVLAGDVVCMPSGRSVVRIDARTGKRIGEIVTKGRVDDPVGNIVIDDQRLLAAGMDRVTAYVNAKSMFDDLDRRIAANADPSLLIERGRLHGESGRARACADDLRRAFGLLGPNDARRAELRSELIGAILSLARQETTAIDDLLAQADSLAQTPGQRATVAMARAESMAQQGKLTDSARAWLDVAASGSQELVVDSDERGLRTTPAVAASLALRKMQAAAPEDAKRELASLSAAAIDRAIAGTPESLVAVGRLLGPQLADRARQAAARLQATKSVEAAELLLSELAGEADPNVAATGLAALAELHQSRGWRSQARREWEQLARDFADQKVRSFEGSPKAGDLAQKKLGELAGVDGRLTMAQMPAPPWRHAWTINGDSLAWLRPAPDTSSEHVAGQLFVHNLRDPAIQCHDLADGRLKWRFDLPKSGRGAVPGVSYSPYASSAANVPSLIHSENVGLARIGSSLWAYSLITGKALWEAKDALAVDANRAAIASGYVAYGGAAEISAASGTAVVRCSPQVARVFDLCTGGLRWEREFTNATISSVAVRNGHVLLTIMRGAHFGGSVPSLTTLICDRLTGRTVTDMETGNRSLGYGSATLWTPWGCIVSGWDAARSFSLQAREIPSGQTRWSVPWKGQQAPSMLELRQDASGRSVLVAGGYNAIGAFDAQTGANLWLAGMERPNSHIQAVGVTRSGHIVAIARHMPDPRVGRYQMAAVVYGLTDGKIRQELNLNANQVGYGVSLPIPASACDDWLPVAHVEAVVNPKPGTPVTQKWNITVYPLSGDGKARPVGLPLPGGKDSVEQLRGMTVVGKYLLVLCKDGLVAIGGDPGKATRE